ncbi:MAG: PAS domain S-box protein [Chloroflexales bacterium]|nr:PAS domain S-box protein [Chloroflexales bacterium]
MTGLPIHLLVVDQHSADVGHLQSTLQVDPLLPMVIAHAGTLAQGRELLARVACDVVLLDPGLPDSQGLASIEHLRQAAPQLPIVVWSEASAEEEAIAALRAGAQDYLSKDPCGFALIGRALRYAIERQRVRIALAEREQRLATDVMLAERAQAAEDLHDAHDLFQLLFHLSPIATTLTSLPERVFLDSNAATEQLVGYSRQQLIGRSTSEFAIFVRPDEHDQIQQLLVDHGRVSGFACTVTTQSGAEKAVLVYIELLNLHGKAYSLTQIVDVTEHRRASEQLAYQARLLDTVHDAIIGTDAALRVTYWNPAAEALFGWTAQEALGRETATLFHTQIADSSREAALTRLMGEGSYDGEVTYLRKDGRAIHAHVKSVLLRDPHGALSGLVTSVHDITERKQAESALRQREAQYRHLFEHHPHPMWVYDRQTLQILAVNDAAVAKYGYTRAEFLRMTIADIRPPEDLERLRENLAQPRPALQHSGVWRHRLKDGTRIDVEITSHLIQLFDREAALVVAQDVTARLQAESALRASEARFATIFEHSPVAIAISRLRENHIVQVNAAFLALAGYPREDVLGHTTLELNLWAHPEERQGVLERLHHGQHVRDIEVSLRQRAGGERIVLLAGDVIELNGEPCGLIQITDITEQKRVELALRASEARFATIFERSPIAISISRLADSRMVEINAAALELTGLRREDVLGHTALELGLWARPDERPQIREQLMQQRLGRGEETILRLPNGTERHVILSGEVVELNGEPCALVQLTDITALKAAQQELLELNRTLEERVQQRTAEVQDLYERAPTGYHSLDAAGAFLRVNQTELDWLGYARDELIGRPFTDIITPEGQVIFQANFPTFKQRGWMRDLEFELIRKDGSTFPVLISATAIYDTSGAYATSRSTLFDITQRKAAEAALRESEAQNRLLFEEAPDAVVLFDPTGRVVRMNRAFTLLTGYPTAQLIGQRLEVHGVLSEQDMAHLSAGDALPQGPEHVSALTLTLRRSDGSERDVGVRVFRLPLRGEPHALTTIRDITAEKQAEAALHLANAELARAARAKDEFLANMSHELRTPLTAILGYSEILLEQIHGPLSAGQQTALRQIAASGQHLLALITDILDLAKVEAGAVELQIASVQVAEVCQASLLLVRQQAAKKALGLELTLAPGLTTVRADPQRLKQMLVNLLANAVKFTPNEGRVRLEVVADVEAEVARFTVEDTGIGIAPEDLARLFQPFVQLDSRLSRRHEGSGLGLALVRRLAELHGGSVTVESTVGVGSRFTISLPVLPPPVRDGPPAEPLDERGAAARLVPDAPVNAEPAMGGARVLLVEDNEESLRLVGDYLRAQGYEVLVARDGLEALHQAEASRPDVIVMDIQLPGMDGLEVMRRIRASGLRDTPILALTALAMPGDRERCLEAGANAYLAKPASLRTLRTMIAAQLGRPTREGSE